MENPSSPLDTLRQLKEMLDSGALTPAEFEALKQQLVFASVPVAPAAPTPLPPTPPAAPVNSVPEVPPAGTIAPVSLAAPEPTADAPLPAPHHGWTEPVHEPAPDSLFLPEASPDFPMPMLRVEHTDEETDTFAPATDELAASAERSSPLGLVLAIGAVLVFLAAVGYLNYNRHPSEHLSSTSHTAADSVATTIETGPQTAPLATTTAAPETLRIAPAHPAPVIAPRPANPMPDSVAPASPAIDSAQTTH